MHLAVYNRNYEEKHLSFIRYFFKILNDNHITFSVYKPLYLVIKDAVQFDQIPRLFESYKDLNNDIEFFICLGGDGTMLNAVTFIREKKIPLLGINLGRLGFLADVPKDKIEFAIQALKTRNFTLDKRTLLHLDSNYPIFGEFPFALNDFTIYRKDTSAMIKINTYLNGQFLNTYWCDGLILATPTGSTGYSLSCNGPVVFPNSSTFVMTPVSPHNLNIRPIIVPDDYVISFELGGRAESFLCTLDSRQESVDQSFQLAIRKEDFIVSLVRIGSNNFLETLREKLYWGVDIRN